jgi:hypothetical protein
MQEIKTTVFDFNGDYDLIVMENYPEEIYHYVLLKRKAEQVARICNDCFSDDDLRGKNEFTGLHKGYPINLQTGTTCGFNTWYLQDKLYLNDLETQMLAKILSNHYGIKFKEFVKQ